MQTKIIVVAGPTAVGKTALGLNLAQTFNGEIISGDSQQVYRFLDIGTAKVSSEEQALIPHHLVDVRNPDETYSAYDFVTEAKEAIADITNRGKLPIIVGGTGLYLQSLLEGYHLGGSVDQQAVLDYRKVLELMSDDQLRIELTKLGTIPSEPNRRRLIRALELAKFGRDLKNRPSNYDAYIIGLNDERQRLYERINQRVDAMMNQGLLEEAKWLYDHYPDAQAARAIGYKEFFPYFKGEQDLSGAVDKLKQNTRHFAKRQLTWFRNRMAVDFYDVSDPRVQETIEAAIRTFLEKKIGE
ncbi:tRNA (adenosine(37)-N6)-dimethylallyltransferase MiaA [Streptococcus dentasini]